MAGGKLDSADFEDSPLPGAEAPDFDLSDETSAVDGNGVGDEQQPETGAQGEPEGVFALFDREFPEEGREPIDPEESSEFDAEFSDSFEHMFTAVKGDGSAPLFEGRPEFSASEKSSEEPEAEDPATEGDEDSVLPIPGSEPKRVATREPDFDEEDELPLPGEPTDEPELQFEEQEPLSLDPYGDEIPLIDPSVPAEGYGAEPETLELLNLDPVVEEEDEIPLTDDFLRLDDEPLPLDAPGAELNLSTADEDEELSSELNAWNSDEEALEEFNFDDSDEDELFDTDLAAVPDDAEDDDEDSFDEFTRLALGIEDDDDEDSISEEDDFKVEELSGAQELDPFEDIAIMSSEDVAKYQGFGEEELKFLDEEPLPEDPDPFAMEGEADSKFAVDEDGYDPLKEIDPFGEEAAALSQDSPAAESSDPEPEDEASEEQEAEKEEKPKKKPRSTGGSKGPSALLGILLFPWKIYSSLTTILFGLLQGLIGILAKIPLIGIPFRMLGSVLAAIPMALKRVIVLLLIAFLAWGGTSIINGFLPKPSADISLPDSGGARFIDVELKDGTVTGSIENTGDVNLLVFPQAKVFERQIFNPGTWFSPIEKGVCGGDLVEIAIDATAKVSYSCDIATDGIVSIEPMLKD